jgi:hypothetical protein
MMGPLFTMIEALGPTETTAYWCNVGPSPIVPANANELAKQMIITTVRPVMLARAKLGKRFSNDIIRSYLRKVKR